MDWSDQGDWQDFASRLAAAADLCLKPHRHGVRLLGELPELGAADGDLCVRIEPRSPEGARLEQGDLELELYRSGADIHLTLVTLADETAPLLWQGSHPVWMDGVSGERCERPEGGVPLEALARRIRALVVGA
jgi:hypothetical protein